MDILEHTEIFGLIAPVAVEIVAFGIVKEFTETCDSFTPRSGKFTSFIVCPVTSFSSTFAPIPATASTYNYYMIEGKCFTMHTYTAA
jgi:hypothetical protein